MGALCVLPARLSSRRIASKPLQILAGKPLIQWTWETAMRVQACEAVWVATDSAEVEQVVRSFGGIAVMTSARHRSGTERVAEVVTRERAHPYDVIVNFQADEPFADPDTIARAIETVRGEQVPVATLAAPIRSAAEWHDASVVKVVAGADGRALYFSRAPIPHAREGTPTFEDDPTSAFLRHIGVYVYQRNVLESWVSSPTSPLEDIEKLEQLRALQAGIPIRIVVGPATEAGVDVPEDLVRAERHLSASPATSESHV